MEGHDGHAPKNNSGRTAVCEYSLENYKNRKAKVGDRLRLKTFVSATMGFVDSKGPDDVAVCLVPDTKLNIKRPIGENAGKLEQAIFVQRDMPNDGVGHRDAIEFKGDPESWLLQDLPEGTIAEVVALPKVMPFEDRSKESSEPELEDA